MVSMGNLIQTLQYQAIERAIGELRAAQQAMYVDTEGDYPELNAVIEECIHKLKDNM